VQINGTREQIFEVNQPQKVMKKICNLIILDASGSMTDKAIEVRLGLLNLFGDIQTADDVKNRTIVCDFSSAGDFNVLIDTKKAHKLTREIAERYQTRGMTALYDAIGKGFNLIDKKYNGVFVNIMTDGLENNSVEFRLKDIQKLIEKKRKKGWAVTFMGTTEEALHEARSMGIPSLNTYKYEDAREGAESAAAMRKAARQRYSDLVMYAPPSERKKKVDRLFDENSERKHPKP
jgi:Mg-chelatase subunit ChlD